MTGEAPFEPERPLWRLTVTAVFRRKSHEKKVGLLVDKHGSPFRMVETDAANLCRSNYETNSKPN